VRQGGVLSPSRAGPWQGSDATSSAEVEPITGVQGQIVVKNTV